MNKKQKEFLISCAQMGAADFLYRKSSRPSRWMNDEEKNLWWEGYNMVKKSCNN